MIYVTGTKRNTFSDDFFHIEILDLIFHFSKSIFYPQLITASESDDSYNEISNLFIKYVRLIFLLL